MSDIGGARREVVLEPLPEHPVPEPGPVSAPRAPAPAHRAVAPRSEAVIA